MNRQSGACYKYQLIKEDYTFLSLFSMVNEHGLTAQIETGDPRTCAIFIYPSMGLQSRVFVFSP